jgi:hypothetical protein
MPVTPRLAHLNAGHALHRGRHALQMLDVHRRQHINAGIQQLKYIFVALAMFAALDIRMGQLVDQRNLRLARQDRVYIHLFKLRAFVFDRFPGHDLELLHKLRHGLSPVRFNHSYHHILATALAANRLRQHGVRLAHARCVPKKELEYTTLLCRGRRFLEPLFRSLSHRDCDYCRREFDLCRLRAANHSQA